ncbi:MAG: hypothetical protein PUK54_02530 [Firmicutes bacterium]|nr:hypothetical protein [Bacillota bacterium]MDD7601471.1 hypothetical protein [Bacillota bacterium]MDY5857043.1 hypothetical protein [Anaerovoracaceae bacterium]
MNHRNHLYGCAADGQVRRITHCCSLCGNISRSIPFKSGFICQDCIERIKAGFPSS